MRHKLELRDAQSPTAELRFFKREFEIRENKKDGFIGTLVGYAAVFNSESEDFGGWRETIAPGAFSRSLRERPDVVALWQHDKKQVLCRTTGNTLRLSEDSIGLRCEMDLIDTSLNRDVLASVRAKNVDAMSFGMIPTKTEWASATDKRNYDLRTLKDVDLYEVSIVTWPAYTDTSLAARDHKQFRDSSRKPTTPFRLLRLRQARLKLN